MKQKNYDEDIAGIVGVVRQNAVNQLLLQAAYYRDKYNKKLPLSEMLVVGPIKNVADFFVGDTIRVEKLTIVNLTKRATTCDFSDLLSKSEIKSLNENHAEFLFNGFLEQVNIIGYSAAFRFRVTSRINAEGKKLRIDKLVDFYADLDSLPADNGMNKSFLTNLFILPLRSALTIKYSRIYDKKSAKMLNYVSFVGIKPLQNARTFLKKNC